MDNKTTKTPVSKLEYMRRRHAARQAAGLCQRCPEPRIDASYCVRHRDERRAAQRRTCAGRGAGYRCGSAHRRAKLTEADIPMICRRLKAGEKQGAIGRSYGVSASVIGLIGLGRTWTHVPREEPAAALLPGEPRPRLPPEAERDASDAQERTELDV